MTGIVDCFDPPQRLVPVGGVKQCAGATEAGQRVETGSVIDGADCFDSLQRLVPVGGVKQCAGATEAGQRAEFGSLTYK